MPRYTPFNWYEQPLYYDIIFDVDTPADADMLEAVHEQFVTARGRRMLEPACGTGRLVTEMANRGFAVTGLDICQPALAYARRRLRASGQRGRLLRAAMESFDLPGQFDIAHCLVSTFKYLLDERSARSHLRCVAKALKPGGVYVLGLHLSEYDNPSRIRERWVAARDGVEVVCNIQSWPPDRRRRTERVRSRLVVSENGTTRRFETAWQFRAYSAHQLRSLVLSVPELEHVATFNFQYDLNQPVQLDGSWLDNLLILRRR